MEVIIKWSKDDECWIATNRDYPKLIGCGDSIREATDNLDKHIADFTGEG